MYKYFIGSEISTNNFCCITSIKCLSDVQNKTNRCTKLLFKFIKNVVVEINNIIAHH